MDIYDIAILTAAIFLQLLAFVYSLIHQVLPSDAQTKDTFKEVVFQGIYIPCFASFALLGAQFASGYWQVWFVVPIIIYFVDIFVPKILAAMFPETLLKFCLKSYSILKYIFLPSAKLSLFLQNVLFKILGYDRRLAFLSESMQEAIRNNDSPEALEEEEKQMIRNIFVFSDTPVREIMTPRVEMSAIDVQTSLPDVINLLNNERHSRLPVYSGSIDNIIGILSNREFLEWYTERPHEVFNLEKLVRPAVFVPTGKKIDTLLHELRESNNHLAIVVDEYGGTAGLATMEDILEEIVGEIKDEDDSEEDMGFVKLPSGQYMLDPLISLSDLEEHLGIHFTIEEDEHIETLSGLIQHTLGSLPKTGTSVEIQGYLFKIKKMEGIKMEEIILENAINPS